MKNTVKKSKNWTIARNKHCALCGSDKVQTRDETKFFNYGTLEKQTELQTEVPVYKCTECNFMYTDHEGDRLCHDAICNFLQVLTPNEVRALRKNAGLTLKEFSKTTGIGQASISRWENGTLIQNKAMDFYLRLLRVLNNLQAIRDRIDTTNKPVVNIPNFEPVPIARLHYQTFDLLQPEQKTFALKQIKTVGGHKIMTPKEVRQIRLNLDQTIRDFSKITGIGAASLCRWEQGSHIQNRAMDNYLFLLSLPNNFKILLNTYKKTSLTNQKNE